jgi:RNA polymerase sigma-70 factor (ECF subfamily)
MKGSEKGDAEIIEAIRQREPDGLAAAYDRYSTVAFSLFLRITRDRSTSEDLLQELFIRVWNRGREFDPQKGALGVWIVAIARNMAIDYIRSAQARFSTRLRPIDSIDPINLLRDGAQPESLLDARRSLAAAFSSLNDNEKRVLELAYFEGCSQSEIAQRLQEPLGTVKSWARSGLGRLRSILKLGAAQ